MLFTDVVGSTGKAVELSDRAWREPLSEHDRIVRAQLARFRGREVNMTGDGVFARFDGPARALRCAWAIAAELEALGLTVRAGVHTGEIEQVNGNVSGIAVHIGARIAAAARPGEVLVSSTVRDITASSGIVFDERGEHELAGVPGSCARSPPGPERRLVRRPRRSGRGDHATLCVGEPWFPHEPPPHSRWAGVDSNHRPWD